MTFQAKILLLDDQQDFNNLFQMKAQERHWEVSTFTQPEDALLAYRDEPFDFVLLDLKLENGSCDAVLTEMLKIRPQTPVYIITAFPSLETVRNSLELGAKDYIAKSLDIDDFLSRLDGIVAELEVNCQANLPFQKEEFLQQVLVNIIEENDYQTVIFDILTRLQEKAKREIALLFNGQYYNADGVVSEQSPKYEHQKALFFGNRKVAELQLQEFLYFDDMETANLIHLLIIALKFCDSL